MKELILYKYKALNTYTIDSIAQKYLFFTRATQLNDPFECWYELNFDFTEEQFREYKKKNHIDEKLTKEKAIELMNSEEHRQKRLANLKSYRVLSLAEKSEIDTMWAYYSENYRGLCLGYRAFSLDESNAKIYIHKPNIKFCPEIHTEEKSTFFNLKKIKYQDDGKVKLNLITKENSNIIANNLFIKKECWSAENEYRSVFIFDDEKDLRIFYPDETLAEVIFGYRMEKENMNMIKYLIEKLYSNQVNFFIANPNLETMTIEKVPFTSENR